MAFSFNWSGLNVGKVTPFDSQAAANRDMENIGKGIRGIVKSRAADEYADMISEYKQSRDADVSGIEQIKAEIRKLEARNAQIRAELQGG